VDILKSFGVFRLFRRHTVYKFLITINSRVDIAIRLSEGMNKQSKTYDYQDQNYFKFGYWHLSLQSQNERTNKNI